MEAGVSCGPLASEHERRKSFACAMRRYVLMKSSAAVIFENGTCMIDGLTLPSASFVRVATEQWRWRPTQLQKNQLETSYI